MMLENAENSIDRKDKKMLRYSGESKINTEYAKIEKKSMDRTRNQEETWKRKA